MPLVKTTWTIRTEGVSDGRQRTDRLICIGVFLYMLGLSYRAAETFVQIPFHDIAAECAQPRRAVAASLSIGAVASGGEKSTR